MSARAEHADLRWSRALAVAGVAVGLGVTGHVTAGGLMPGADVVVLLLVVASVVSATVLGGPASYRTLVALVAGGQAGIHLVLTLVSGHAGDHVEGAGGLPHWLQHLRADLTGTHALMALAHLAAAAGVAGWLLLGERAAWTLVALLGRHVRLRLAAGWWLSRPVPAHRGRPVLPKVEPGARALVAASGPVGRRGPPASALVLLAPPV